MGRSTRLIGMLVWGSSQRGFHTCLIYCNRYILGHGRSFTKIGHIDDDYSWVRGTNHIRITRLLDRHGHLPTWWYLKKLKITSITSFIFECGMGVAVIIRGWSIEPPVLQPIPIVCFCFSSFIWSILWFYTLWCEPKRTPYYLICLKGSPTFIESTWWISKNKRLEEETWLAIPGGAYSTRTNRA